MNAIVSFNRILGWVYLAIGVLVSAGWLVAKAPAVLRVGALLVSLGALHLLAARGFEQERPWRWASQVAPAAVLLAYLLWATL